MNPVRADEPTAVRETYSLTRRDLLKALGIGGPIAFASGAGLAVAQDATPSTGVPERETGIRNPGGPSISDKVFELGADIDAIFAFVRDEVRYEAYSGALRGPLGTLWGLAGNSVDQAQLLAAMLNEAQVITRLVAGTLDDSNVTALFTSMELGLDAAREHSAQVNSLPQQQPVSGRLTEDQRKLLDELTVKGEALASEARTQLAAGVELIMTAIAEAGVTLPDRVVSLPDRERTQHVWLQYAYGNTWVDLDPSFPEAEPGKSFASAPITLDTLPEDNFHTMTFRLVAEKVISGQLQRADVLTHNAKSQDLIGTSLTLLHLQPESIKGLGVAVEGTLNGTVQYMPHLAIGSEDVVAPTDRITFVTEGGLGDVFGGVAPDGDTVAEWFEVTIASPDSPDRHIAREVFDRIDPEARAGGKIDLAQISPAALSDLGDGGGPTFLPFVSFWSIAAITGEVPASYFDQDYSINDLYSDLGLIPHGFHLMRDAYSIILADAGGPRMYVNRPNLTALLLSARDLTPDSITVEPTMDLLFQSVVPLAWDSGLAESATAHVAAGVLNHVAERQLLSGDNTSNIDLSPGISVWSVFEEARRQGIPVTVLLPNEPIPPAVTLSIRSQTLIQKALGEGYLVLAPEEPVELDGTKLTGWWQVHLETAETLDMMENGRSTTAEHATTIRIGTQATPALRRMAACGVATAFIYAGLTMGGILAGAAGGTLVATGGNPNLLALGVMLLGAGQGGALAGAGAGAAAALGC